MKFEQMPVALSEGRILAHSFVSEQFKLSKGCVISGNLIAQMIAAGAEEVSTVTPDAGDIGERDAALALAEALAGQGVYADLKASGAVDLRACEDGVLILAEATIHQCNLSMRSATIATRSPNSVVKKGERVATIKVIPYCIKARLITSICQRLSSLTDVIAVAEFKPLNVGLIQTTSAQQRDPLFDKTAEVIGERLNGLKATVNVVVRCGHQADEIQNALRVQLRQGAELIVLVGPTAIVDEHDLIPTCIRATGGRVEHYGMPVEPGHMLLLAYNKTVPIIGAPTCIRSPRNNGFDMLLSRFAAGLPVSSVDIMQMGVGGLLR